MISDVLFEAVQEIERYEKEMPESYASEPLKSKIKAVKDTMTALQRELDTPPESVDSVA